MTRKTRMFAITFGLCALPLGEPQTTSSHPNGDPETANLNLRFDGRRTDVYHVVAKLVGGVPTDETVAQDVPTWRYPHDEFELEATEKLELNPRSAEFARVSYGWQAFKLREVKAGRLALECKVDGFGDLRKIAGEPAVLRFGGYVEAPIQYGLEASGAIEDVTLPRPLLGFDADHILQGYANDMAALHALVRPTQPVEIGATWSRQQTFRQGAWLPVETFPGVTCDISATYSRNEERQGVPCAIVAQEAILSEPLTITQEALGASSTVEQLRVSSEFAVSLADGRIVQETSSARMMMRIDRESLDEDSPQRRVRLIANRQLQRTLDVPSTEGE
ncbi:MAG: hypothetical protein AAF628_12910 [Planctomycetota bacterium]